MQQKQAQICERVVDLKITHWVDKMRKEISKANKAYNGTNERDMSWRMINDPSLRQ